MPVPTYTVWLDLNNNGAFDHAQSNISAYVKEITVSLGRSRDFDKNVMGTLELRLKNSTGLFSPENTSSALYPNLKANRAIKVQATYSGTDYALFYGYISGITPHPDRLQQDVYMTAGDLFKRLKNERLTTELWEGETVNNIIDYILTGANYLNLDAANVSIDEDDTVIPYAWWLDTPALTALEDLLTAVSGQHYIAPDVTNGYLYVYENRHHLLQGNHGVSQETWDETAYREMPSYQFDDSQVINDVEVEARIRKELASADIWTDENANTTDPWFINQQQSGNDIHIITVWATLAEPSKSIIAPVGGTDYTANTSPDGTGTALETVTGNGEVTIVTTIYGQAVKLVITNNHAGKAYITLLKIRGVEVALQDTLLCLESSATSQADYGKRHSRFSTELIATSARATELAQYILMLRKQPQAEPEVTRQNKFPSQLQRCLGDRITLQHTTLGIDTDYHIVSIEHQIDMAGKRHATTYRLQRAEPPDYYWQLDGRQTTINGAPAGTTVALSSMEGVRANLTLWNDTRSMGAIIDAVGATSVTVSDAADIATWQSGDTVRAGMGIDRGYITW